MSAILAPDDPEDDPSLDLRFADRAGGTRLVRKRVRYLHSVTSVLRWDGLPSNAAGLVLQSASGGFYPGEDVMQRCGVGPGAVACVTSQGATVVQGTREGSAASVVTHLDVARSGRLAWCPLPCLLRPEAALVQALRVRLAVGATVLIVDGFALPPEGSHRTLRARLDVLDSDGRLVLAERLRLDDADASRPDPALTGPHRAFATLWWLGVEPPRGLREWLQGRIGQAALLEGAVGAAPGLPGLIIRLAAPAAGPVVGLIVRLRDILMARLLESQRHGVAA